MRILRRFNYTHRSKIPARKVHIDVEAGDSGSCLATVRQLDLSEPGNHDELQWNAADVFLEARRLRTGSFRRGKIGEVKDFSHGDHVVKTRLEDFGDESDITFRIKVVDANGRLLADGDGIRAGERRDDETEPLIHLIPAELGEEIWRIDWDPEGPRVLVNKNLLNSSRLLTRDALVRGLVLPQIVRQVLPGALASEQKTDRWVQKWLEFASRLGHDEPPDSSYDDEDAVSDWVEAVVAAFAISLKLATHAEEHLQKGADI